MTKWLSQKFIFAVIVVVVISACGQTLTQTSEFQTSDHPSCESIVFNSGGDPVDAMLCLPAGPQLNLPAVVFLHGIGAFEPWDPDIEDTMGYTIHRELAEHGFVTLSILYFSRTPPPPGPLPNTFTDAPYQALVEARPTWISTIEDGLSYLKSRPEVDPDRIGMVGYSLGASLALGLDQNRNDYAALVLISGQVWMDEDLAQLTAGEAPTLILQEEAEDVVPMSEALRIKDALEAYDIEHEFVVIQGADHRWIGQVGDQGFDAIAEFLESHLSP